MERTALASTMMIFITTFADCAEACVQDVDKVFTKTMFRGIDYINESNGKGQCLYDDLTLGSKSKAVEKTDFYETNCNGDGVGPV